ncbi:MAG: 4Fe-4S dicluster domain-containing protein [Candidatus Nezhaarchaeota archaeon]|nr:4Fe-4S dicluster domain-containing protein [Candidatus Nezhaarchaeota archaeon]
MNTFSFDVNKCIQCGSCASACPVSRATRRFNPRLIVLAFKRKAVLRSEDVWLCLNCHVCEARCPNAVKVSQMILEERRKVLESHGEDRVFEFYSTWIRALLDSGVIAFATNTKVEDFKAESGLNIPTLTENVKLELRDFLRSISLEARIKEVMSFER